MAVKEDRRVETQQPSHLEKVEASRLIDTVVRWADSAPAGLDVFSLRVPNPSPGLVTLLEKTARDLSEQGGYEGGTPGEDSHIGRIRHIFRASGLLKGKFASALQVPETNLYRWLQPREKGGTAPGYSHLERISTFAKRLGIPGNLLDDSICQPMTVEPLDKPESEPVWAVNAGARSSNGVLVTFTNAAIELLKNRSPDPP